MIEIWPIVFGGIGTGLVLVITILLWGEEFTDETQDPEFSWGEDHGD